MNKPISDTIQNFTWAEVVDPLTGLARADAPRFWAHMALLQDLRTWWGDSLTVTSGWRTPEHNAIIGGAGDSQHLLFLGQTEIDEQECRFATDILPGLKSNKIPVTKAAIASTPTSKYLGVVAVNLLAERAEALGFRGIIRYLSVDTPFLHLDLRAKPYRETR